MVSVFDVVKYILTKKNNITAMKLQKLVYYCQAWSLVWDSKPLFRENVEAWANGPVVRELYEWHRGKYNIPSCSHGRITKLDSNQKSTIDAVLDYYGDKSPQWLSDLTHMEYPWRKARIELPDNARGSNEITLASMEEYYTSINDKN